MDRWIPPIFTIICYLSSSETAATQCHLPRVLLHSKRKFSLLKTSSFNNYIRSFAFHAFTLHYFTSHYNYITLGPRCFLVFKETTGVHRSLWQPNWNLHWTLISHATQRPVLNFRGNTSEFGDHN